jgi:hypothetical protein
LRQQARDDVFRKRILQGPKSYTLRQLGAFGSDLGVIACFFSSPWKDVSPDIKEAEHAWVLAEAAFALRSLGRLSESLGPMRAGLEKLTTGRNWRQAGIAAGNLSELELLLGEVTGALRDAALAVTYTDRNDDLGQRMGKRATRADALHQAGRRAEAEKDFREAEQIQKPHQPGSPLLYSMRGFRYCDLLLGAAERAAWQIILSRNHGPHHSTVNLVNSCRSVFERATQTLKWEEEMPDAPLLDFALCHVTLGRAALYQAILEGEAAEGDSSHHDRWGTARRQLETAVTRLRHAGTAPHIPRGLLSRAVLRHLDEASTGLESAQADIDDAWEIAERGPMRLHMADIHLHRARLFFREAKYPWDSPAADLAAARKLIERCGYGRRLEELADAEAVVLSKRD